MPAGIVTGRDSPERVNVELLLLVAVTVTLDPLAVRVPDAVPVVPATTLPRARVAGLTVRVAGFVEVPIPVSGRVTVEFEAVE